MDYKSEALPARSWLSGLPRLLVLRSAPGLAEAPVWLAWVLGLLALALWIGLDWLRAGPGAWFSVYGVTGIGWYLLMLLAVAAALSGYSKPRVTLRSALALLFAVAVILLLLAGADMVTPLSRTVQSAAGIAVAVYCLFVTGRTLGAVSGRRQPRAVLNGAFVAGAAWLATTLLYVDPGLWYTPVAEADADYSLYEERGESLLFDQPQRIDTAAAEIVPPENDAPAVFFLGFAGYGEERVFAEEIEFAANVIAERYGTAERTLLLLNDRRDLDSEPLATVSSLRYALQKIAAKMAVEDDVLFLALSSHGSPDELAVSHGPLMLDDLTDEALADALADAGIKWRVIVVSACYSGSFIDALQNPNTIVITAAAADRTSFGCNDQRELTYFGEAFYRDALPGAGSLREAFEMTVEAIAERERREDIEPSHPQAHFGEAVEERLGALEDGTAP